MFYVCWAGYRPFQFTHPGGVRPSRRCAHSNTRTVSIHAPGRGATYPPASTCLLPCCFNSRTREGCDCRRGCVRDRSPPFQFTHPGGVRLIRTLNDYGNEFVSIHAPGRGATSSDTLEEMALTGFNSRTREGCDVKLAYRYYDGVVSIHAPGRGATLLKKAVRHLYEFQFTHPGGVRPEPNESNRGISRRFNSRTREGCDSKNVDSLEYNE